MVMPLRTISKLSFEHPQAVTTNQQMKKFVKQTLQCCNLEAKIGTTKEGRINNSKCMLHKMHEGIMSILVWNAY